MHKKIHKREILLANICCDLQMEIPECVICRVHGLNTGALYRLLTDDEAATEDAEAQART